MAWRPSRISLPRKMSTTKLAFEYLEKLLELSPDVHIQNVYIEAETATVGITTTAPWMQDVIEGAQFPVVSLEKLRGWDE